jgi:hypothetical protein
MRGMSRADIETIYQVAKRMRAEASLIIDVTPRAVEVARTKELKP